MKKFLLGYGSILNSASRAKTSGTQSGIVIPASLLGYERRHAQDIPRQISSVGTVENTQGRINGVLTEIPEEAWQDWEKRERNYRLVEVKPDSIELYGNNSLDGKIYFYLSPEIITPDKEHPILTTYLDVVLQGAMEIDVSLESSDFQFTREVIATTVGWDAPWINDRKKPAYAGTVLRYDKLNNEERELIDKIDKVLNEMVSGFFVNRVPYRPEHVVQDTGA